jgi:hypothetical protein
VSWTIRYRHPQRPDEAGITVVVDEANAAAMKDWSPRSRPRRLPRRMAGTNLTVPDTPKLEIVPQLATSGNGSTNSSGRLTLSKGSDRLVSQREEWMPDIFWRSTSIDVVLYCFTATVAHFLMSFGQTLFHRYLGHRHVGGRFFRNHVQFHHTNYSGDHVVSSRYIGEEGNNTPFFLIPTALVVCVSYFFLRLDLFVVLLTAMSLSFYGHVYLDKQYHVAGSWLGRFLWFRRKQQLHFAHHCHPNCNFAVIDYFWDRLLGTYRSVDRRGTRPGPQRRIPVLPDPCWGLAARIFPRRCGRG